MNNAHLQHGFPAVSGGPGMKALLAHRLRAHDFVIKDAHFVNNTQINQAAPTKAPMGPGLKVLLKNSMPEAFHDSLARYPPPRCHLGTREKYISLIMEWALRESEHKEPVLWLRGPFGIGKSAVAQSSAEALKLKKKLLATLFLSHSNVNWDEPGHVFPSLVYQATTLCKEFATIIDARIQEDLAIPTKSLPAQFEELLVIPLQQLDAATSASLEGRIIIIDGLDEC